MKIISLNIWGGVVYEPLIKFIEKNKDIDIFCFQEVLFAEHEDHSAKFKARLNICNEIQKILVEHECFKSWDKDSDYFEDEFLENVPFGQTIFYKKNIEVIQKGFFSCHGDYKNTKGGKVTGKCQWIKCVERNREIYLLNFHGLSQLNTFKRDTVERLFQSTILKEFIKDKSCILLGDFNLNPETESMQVLDSVLINLIGKYQILNTRSDIYSKPERFADYILISNDIEEKDFMVFQDQVSDHLPLYLEY